MNILALDLGTKCGWAYSSGGVVISGVWDLKPGRFDGGGMRFVKFRSALNEIHASNPVGMCVFEEVRRHIGTDAAHVYGGLMAVVTEWCETNKVPYEGVPVQEIKKFATGSGNAKKDKVIAAVESWGYSVEDDNHADALALLHSRIGILPSEMMK